MSKNQDEIQERIVRKRWKNELSRQSISYSSYRPKKRNKSKKVVEHFTFEKNFSIYSADKDKSYQDTINIINAISRFSKSGLKKAHLDFSKTEVIKAAAILILYATVEQAIKEGVSFKIVSFPRDFKAIRIIKKSGLEILCRDNIHKPDFDGEYLPVIGGSSGQYRDDIVDFIQQKIYKNKMSAHTESIYGGAIHEAINNVAYHAYPDTHELENKRWWVKCDLAGDQLFLALYDKGVGIPETVMNRSWYEEILKSSYPDLKEKISEELISHGIAKSDMLLYKVGVVSDAMKIAISMIGDITGTKSSKHGQGSKSIKALVSENDLGKLWIYSNHGLYKLESDTIETVDLPKPMPGTLLQWNIEVTFDEHKND